MENARYHSVHSRLLITSLKTYKIYKTIILSFVLCGCETWCLTLSEELRLIVYENNVLRKIFGSKREEEVGGWRRLHTEELHNLYT
jgi:hypothetical protein